MSLTNHLHRPIYWPQTNLHLPQTRHQKPCCPLINSQITSLLVTRPNLYHLIGQQLKVFAQKCLQPKSIILDGCNTTLLPLFWQMVFIIVEMHFFKNQKLVHSSLSCQHFTFVRNCLYFFSHNFALKRIQLTLLWNQDACLWKCRLKLKTPFGLSYFSDSVGCSLCVCSSTTATCRRWMN